MRRKKLPIFGEPLAKELLEELAAARPHTRADCLPGGKNCERPCVFFSCRHHLFLDVTERGEILACHPDLLGMQDTCALDVAARGGLSLDEVGERIGVTREQARQVELQGLLSMQEHILSHPDDFELELQEEWRRLLQTELDG